MRRLLPLLPFPLVVLAFAVLSQGAATFAAVTYPAGWNLVSGPDGSTLSGAIGPVYSYQPGDTAYESFPATAPLKGGWAYWAYFPTGGSLKAAADRGSYTVTLTPGQLAMVGDPSATGSAAVDGADTIITYTPADGYQNSTSIPPGQGAWMLAQGAVTLMAAVGPPPTATSTATAGPATNVTTLAGLKAVALTAADVPGFKLSSDGTSPQGDKYAAIWDSNSATGITRITEVFTLATTASDAANALNTPPPALQNVQTLSRQGIGDTDTAISGSQTDPTGATFDVYVESFQRGNSVFAISVVAHAGSGSITDAAHYAAIVDSHITGLPPRAIPTVTPTP